MYWPSSVPVSTGPMFQVNIQARPVLPFSISGPFTVPSSSQFPASGREDVVTSKTTVVVLEVTT